MAYSGHAAATEPFRVWEYLANDPSVDAGDRLRATERLVELGQTARAATAFWNLAVEPAVPPPLRIDAAERLRELDVARCTGAYRVMVYDRSVPRPLRFQAAEQLWGLVPADGDRALRDLCREQSRS